MAMGTATLTLNAARTMVTYRVMHTAMGATAAHLHLGMAGENGGVAFALSGSGATIEGSAAVTPEQATAIEQGRTYFNVHTMAHADGELRGQVHRPGETLWVARLSGDQENPPVTTTSTGLGNLFAHAMTNRVRFNVRTSAMGTAAHVHLAPGGRNGPVVLALGDAMMVDMNRVYTGEAAAPMAGSLMDLTAGRWYFNVHTTTNPMGEVRGQLLRPGETLYTAQLTGGAEVPPVTTMASGSVAVIASADRAQLAYDAALSTITPTAGHLHVAPAGMNGGVAFPLTITAMGGAGTLMTGMATGMTGPAFISALDAGNVYLNVHTAAHMNGELRGQLARRPAR
jgi:hypothetical protein